MSGFAGVFHLDGAPIDPAWMETMAAFLRFRGPDASQVWVSGNAGLCHTLLRSSTETDGRPQIASLDGCIWIAGDVRIDDRQTLIAALPASPADLNRSSSSELMLHAYLAWGDACVERVLGDFSFVVWDARRNHVFGARDHLGVRPLYYARVGACVLISNTLDCIRQSPLISDELNEAAIGDHLIAGMNFNPATTFFASIQRLPAAHRLLAGAGGLRTERYWQPPIDEPLYYKRRSDYVEHFHELLHSAVCDRLPDGPLGILMSGGLDSPALAVAAVELGAKPIAVTWVYDRLIPDQERHYAGLVAQHLGIPIHYKVQDDEPWGWEPGAKPIHTPEPCDPLGLVAFQQFRREISAHARVFFLGYGPDAALQYEWRSHLTYLARQRRWVRLCRDLAFHFTAHKRLPLIPSLPRMWKERRSQPNWYDPSLPAWIDQEFQASHRLTERFAEIMRHTPSPHPIRKTAHASFAGDLSAGGLDGYDPGFTGMATELRDPFLDLRLLQFLLAVPAIPWCRDKYLIRMALRGSLPESIRRRPKAPVPGFPYLDRARRNHQPQLPEYSGLSRYVDLKKLPPWPGRDREEFDYFVRVLGLHYWLNGL